MTGKKWSKRLISAVLLVVLTCSLTLPSFAAQESGWNSTLKIAVLSDLHYLSPTMIKDTADYTTDLNSDRKLLTEGHAIDSALLDAVAEDQPDVLLISGDLTKDGELEGHRELAQKLQALQDKVPGLKIYVAPGNHDVRNALGKNFNTADGNAVPATRTNPEDFKQVYDFVYSDESVIAAFTPAAGKEAGGLSYVARPAEGYTVIAMDTCRYSADNTDSGENEHETSGAISAELRAWVVEQCRQAKARGDVVIGLEHHGLVQHFDMESTVLPMYLVNDYENIAQEYADAGMDMVFTGHMHANDIAAMTTAQGNTLYDIETGSALTYPSPMRFVEIRKTAASTLVNVATKTHVGPISYIDPLTGKPTTIEDVTDYGQARGFSTEMLQTVLGAYVGDFFGKFLPQNKWPVTAIVANIDKVVADLTAIPVTTDKSLLDFVNYIYQSHLAGEDDGNWPAWVQTGIDRIQNGELLDAVIKVVATDAFGSSGAMMTQFQGLFTKLVKNKINDFLLSIVTSMGKDSNYPNDNDTRFLLSGGSDLQLASVTVTGNAGSTDAQACVKNGAATVFLSMRQLAAVTDGQPAGTVTVDASNFQVDSVVLPGRTVAWALDNSMVSALAVALPDGAVTLDRKALGTVEQGRDVSFALGDAALTAAQVRALGKRMDAMTVLAADVTVGGETVDTFGGSVTVTVPYTLKNGETAADLTAWSVADTGEIAAAGGYDATSSTVTFQSNDPTALVIAHFPFTDVAAKSWYYSNVAYTYNNMLFKGVTDTTFAPAATMTRGMLVTTLWRLEGEPSAPAASFGDLTADWYRAAVNWAAANDVVRGYSASKFGPNDTMTREQMATILYRYAQLKDCDMSGSASLDGFRDAAKVSGWASAATSWAVANGILQGDTNKLLTPTAGAQRCQVAAVLQRYLENCIYAK